MVDANAYYCRDDAELIASADRRLFCLVDGPGATWRISFERPLRQSRSEGKIAFAALGERCFDGMSLKDTTAALEGALHAFRPTAVVVSRCGTQAGPILMRLARARHLPVIYHLDDDLFAVPRELGPSKYAFYTSVARQSAMHECCGLSDLIYCSTARLRYRLGRFGFKTPLRDGAIYCSAPTELKSFMPRRPPVIGYMGTAGHATDLDMVVPAIELVMTDRTDLRFEVFGSLAMPARLAERFPGRVSHVAPTDDYDSFLAKLATLGWSIGLAPLTDIPFNSVKANTKFVEYTSAGIPAIASHGPVYDKIIAAGAAAGAKTSLDWGNMIVRLLADAGGAEAQVVAAQNWVRNNVGIEAHARQVMAVLDSVSHRQGSDISVA